MPPTERKLLGPAMVSFAILLFSLNDATMKFLSGNYALHEIVMIRSIVGFVLVVTIMAPLNGGLHLLKTRRPLMQLLRALFVLFANMTFFMGLAALPLADAVSLFFISPFLITIFSVIFLGETVGLRRWIAIAVGLLGVGIVLRPGTEAFRVEAFFPLAAAFGYAGLHIMTRHLRDTENASALTFYIQVVFLTVSLILGLTIGDGRFATQNDPSLDFLLRAWVWPEASDIVFLLILGVFASVGGYFISQGYRLAPAALAAPFEYLALPLSILFGVIFFSEWPDGYALAGSSLIIASGLYTVWREHQVSKHTSHAAVRPMPR